MPEKWLPVLKWKGLYEISDQGRVKSLARKDRLGRHVSERILKQKLSGSTSPRWSVQLHRDGYVQQVYVHTLMLESFIEPRPIGAVARHRDDTNRNVLSNLMWGTVSENNHDIVRNGNNALAKRTHCKKAGHELTEENIYRPPGRGNARYCRKCAQDKWNEQKSNHQYVRGPYKSRRKPA